MRRGSLVAMIFLFYFSTTSEAGLLPYAIDSTVPQSGGCPQPNRWNLSFSSPLNRR
jgi:hypothetical protein